jgi:hypothetical protein
LISTLDDINNIDIKTEKSFQKKKKKKTQKRDKEEEE